MASLIDDHVMSCGRRCNLISVLYGRFVPDCHLWTSLIVVASAISCGHDHIAHMSIGSEFRLVHSGMLS